jgi:predicted tellurium resistance membrane protein TerC
MNFLPAPDPLVSLWQTAPKPDTQDLLQDLQRLKQSHRRLNRIVFAIMCCISLLIILEEATGRVTTHGALSVIWILGLMLGVIWHRSARCARSDSLTLDTVSLLKSMITGAKSDLLVARCLYAGVPCGAVVGFLAVKLAGHNSSPTPIDVNAHLQIIQTGAGLAALLAMIVTGVILARSRRAQVQALSEKLRSIDSDL